MQKVFLALIMGALLALSVVGALVLVSCSPSASLPQHAAELALCRQKNLAPRDAALEARVEAYERYEQCRDEANERHGGVK